MGYKKGKLWKKILKRTKYNNTWKTEQCNHGYLNSPYRLIGCINFHRGTPKEDTRVSKTKFMYTRMFYTYMLGTFLQIRQKEHKWIFVKLQLTSTLGPLYLLYLNFQIHNWPIWLSQVTINIVSGDNIDPVAFLNKKDSFYVLSTNIYIYEALFPTPIIFEGDWLRGTVFDLKQILLQWPKHTNQNFPEKTDIGPKVLTN